MLRLQENELIQLFRQPGGSDFAEFCDLIIRAHCFVHAVPQSEISFTSRSDIKDGGVDERVGTAVPGDETGFFGDKSAWQFKAGDEAKVTKPSVVKEVKKRYARERILAGDAYRICICDHLTPTKKESLEQALVAAVQSINAGAPKPYVLSIKDVCELANAFPALVMRYRPGMSGACILFDAWRQMATQVTPTFVPDEKYPSTRNAILNHTDFGRQVEDIVLTLHGQSGVGKTRSVFESLSEISAASSIVIYLNDEEQVSTLANQLANDQTSRAILVADECSLDTRVRLSRTLAPCKKRVRCICIDNSLERLSSAAPQLTVEKPNELALQNILSANYPQIASERIRAYAQLSEGFVRLAADMCCYYDEKIVQAGHFGPIAEKLEEYYRERLGNEDRLKAVEAIALLKRVKRKGDLPTELELICQLTGVNRKTIEQTLAEIKDAPGFIERGELYYRVTPELIAAIAFEAGWKRWAESDPQRFLRDMPEPIQESFIQRVSEGRSGEVRKIVQEFFRRFADSFTSRDLRDINLVNRLIGLIETDAEMYLPLLRHTLEAAPSEDLVSESTNWLGSWGPRRELVWMAEKFVQFPEFFGECEKILYVLALNECENNLSNNATNIWQQLFRIQLSGTALPFPERLEILRIRMREATDHAASVLSGGLASTLEFHGYRMVGPTVVAGRMVPSEWYPKREEMPGYVEAALKLLNETMAHPIPELASQARAIFIEKVEWLARQGWTRVLKPIVASSHMGEDDRARLVGRLNGFLASAKSAGNLLNEQYELELKSWIDELRPVSLHSRLVEVVASQAWDHYGRENEWETALKVLAEEFLTDAHAIESELDWLTSPDAASAFNFGRALGSLSTDEGLLPRILEHSINRDAALARGYVSGLLSQPNVGTEAINLKLDELEEKYPIFAFQIALVGGERIKTFERAVRLIETGKLPAYHLRNFTHWVGSARVSDAQVLTALKLLLPHAEANEYPYSDALMDFLGARLYENRLKNLMAEEPELVWRILEFFTEHPGRQEVFWWAKCMDAMVSIDPSRAIKITCKGLVSESFQMSDNASQLLSSWAPRYPEEIMSELGSVVLDDRYGVRFFISKFPIFNALPQTTVKNWLTKVGAKGAQRVARHLPSPFVNADGKPVLPELTEWVLSEFEDDDRVFAEFCAGVHSYQVYRGDAALEHEVEANVARKFFAHPVPRIRQWAKAEHASALKSAQIHREWEDSTR